MGSSMLVCFVRRAGSVLVSSPKYNYNYNYLGSQIGGISRGVLKAYSSVAAGGSSALLMLPSSFGSRGVMNASSVAEERVISINKEAGASGVCMKESTVVGSSHGWVALFNWKSYEGDLHLWHPLSGRGVKLPALSSLPDIFPEIEHKRNSMKLRHDEKNSNWTNPTDEKNSNYYHDILISRLHIDRDKWTDPTGELIVKHYLDIVYSRFHKLFFCITNRNDNDLEEEELEAWDFSSTSSPSDPLTVVRLKYEEDKEEEYPETEDSSWDEDKDHPEMAKYLVFEDEDNSGGQLLLVTRHMVWKPSYEPFRYRTTGFDVHTVDRDNGKLRHLKSLGGLSIFVGNNNSVALKSPQLKPNSIYFIDSNASEYNPQKDHVFCGQDMGVFDYENTTFSPCYYNPPYTHISTTMPPPFC
ncbi:hypothetical protein OROMI_004094 [Orobanche minor]